MFARLALFAQTAAEKTAENAADARQRLEETFQFGRLINFQPWQYLLLSAVIVLVIGLVLFIYRRDSAELGWFTAILLVVLRLGAFLGLLWVFLLPQFRIDQIQTVDSRVLLLIDTSNSMTIKDPGEEQERMDKVVNMLKENLLLRELRKEHQIVVIGFDSATDTVETLGKLAPGDPGEDAAEKEWAKLLEAKGGETRMGESLRKVIDDNIGNPTLAALVVVSDGGHNTGRDPDDALRRAAEHELPIFTIGVGSEKRDVDYWIDELVAPKQVYQGPDEFAVTVVVNGQGVPPEAELLIDLFRVPAGQPITAADEPLETRTITLAGQAVTETFQLPAETADTYDIVARVRSSLPNVAKSERMEMVGRVTVVDHKLKVLLFASGPTREYRFVRNQLRRDNSMIVDVLLQTAQHRRGIAQDVNKILEHFPEEAAELLEYDCIVAFDPDWEALTDDQIGMLHEWVDKRAGGLIVLPGPVHTDDWVHTSVRESIDKIKTLYPVRFHRRFDPDLQDFSNTEARRVLIANERQDDRYIWLADDKGANERAWAEFEGVYGHFRIEGPKKGAVVVAHLEAGDEIFAEKPVYMAWQFYGAGRVFYIGSGEMWRVRALDEAHFESLWTKLIRFTSQGALQRGLTKRGMLFLDNGNKYQLGDTVPVRAKLDNAQGEPLIASQVTLEVLGKDGELRRVPLEMVEGEAGHFRGQFTADRAPRYILNLKIPDSDDVLEDYIEVEEPEPEKRNPVRDDATLAKIAGDPKRVYVGLDAPLAFSQLVDLAKDQVYGDAPAGAQWAGDIAAAFAQDKADAERKLQTWRRELDDQRKETADRLISYVQSKQQKDAPPALYAAISDKSQEQTRLDAVKRLWDNAWTLLFIVGMLCLEWLIRRLNKLA